MKPETNKDKDQKKLTKVQKEILDQKAAVKEKQVADKKIIKK